MMKAGDYMAFKDNLKHLRENAGYKQAKDFAKAAGIPYSSYATYERGSWPNEANLTRIALTLHASIDELMGYTPSPLSTIQQIKQDFANVGYELKEEGSTWWRYEITEPGEEYPFHVKTEDDLKQIYQQIKLDVFRDLKKVWADNIHDALVDYERKLNKEENQAYLRIQMKLLEQMKPLSDKMMKAEAEGDTKTLGSLQETLFKLLEKSNIKGIGGTDKKK
ncbi:helix-turn-helix domain-containing protein [Megasphaera elsdenii]|uniref:helix-turn-helix domain-containing protein n=1 Tax=Megasphaera elsdenii TaxID=907 RepID=UPI002A8C385E|nr:helix-turn-helix transcriptional regulator [Megasphaera elsdenii]